MSFILIGSVESSDVFLRKCIETGHPPEYVFGLDEKYSDNVSGFVPIYETAEKFGIKNIRIKKINDEYERIRDIEPDYIAVIGISQLISEKIIACAKKMVIGLHPTKLPKHRGRAAIPWQIILGVKDSAVTLFELGKGMDDGNILWQEPYTISEQDYAVDVHRSIMIALERAVENSIDSILSGNIRGVPQNEDEATYLLIRREEDGRINWKDNPDSIYTLIRAASAPYPGAFAYYQNSKVIIDKAELVMNKNVIGIPGQIADIANKYIDIFIGEYFLRVHEYRCVDDCKFIVGRKFT